MTIHWLVSVTRVHERVPCHHVHLGTVAEYPGKTRLLYCCSFHGADRAYIPGNVHMYSTYYIFHAPIIVFPSNTTVSNMRSCNGSRCMHARTRTLMNQSAHHIHFNIYPNKERAGENPLSVMYHSKTAYFHHWPAQGYRPVSFYSSGIFSPWTFPQWKRTYPTKVLVSCGNKDHSWRHCRPAI